MTIYAFDSLYFRNQYINKRWTYYIQRYENNNMKNWRIKINVNLLFNQFNSSSSQSFVSKFAINQNALINKNSKNLNSRNLKQYTFAKSISFCYCFCFICSKNRSFHHINLQMSFASIEIKIFIQDFHFRDLRIYLFSFFCLRTSFVFAFIFSRLSHLFWNFQF